MAELEMWTLLKCGDRTTLQISKYTDCSDFYVIWEDPGNITSTYVSGKELSEFAFRLNNLMKDYDA